MLAKMVSVSLIFFWGLALSTFRKRNPIRLSTWAIVLGAGSWAASSPWARNASRAAWAGGLCTEAQDACPPLGQAKLDRVPSPTKHTFGLAGVATAVFQRHFRLKGA